MKIIYAFVFFVSMLSTGVVSYGQDAINFAIGMAPYRISLAAEAGVILGQSEEIVYKDSRTNYYLSQLLWDLKPLVYLGSSLSFSRAEPLAGLGAVADMSVKFGIPLESGTMEDRDWMNNADSAPSHFSSHDAYLEKAWLFDVSGGISIPIKSVVALEALLSFSAMRFSWDGRDGYLQYPEDNGGKRPMEGSVITYEQTWVILSPGLGLSWPVYPLSLDFRFFISPLIFAWDEDNHVVKKVQYEDTMRWGLYLEPAVAISFSPSRYFSLTAHGSWRYIGRLGNFSPRGDSVVMPEAGGSSSTANNAGAGYNAFDVGLSLKFALPF
jgi:outer membrane protease